MQLSLRAAPSTPRRAARPVVAQAQGAGASADSAGAATAALGRREAATLAALALACSSEPAHALQRIGRGGSKSKDVPLEDYTTLSSGVNVYDVTTGSGQVGGDVWTRRRVDAVWTRPPACVSRSSQVATLGDRVVIHYDCRIAGKKLTISSSRVGAGVTGGEAFRELGDGCLC